MIAIIKYNAGNVQSVQYALQRLGADSIITDDPVLIQQADKVIFPGVGHAAAAMHSLRENKLDSVIVNLRQPVLGICLGLQLLCKHSIEGDTNCLGIFDADVKLFSSLNMKVPQIGWNTICNYQSILFNGLQDAAFVYSVHSYYAEVNAQTIATTNYTLQYSAAMQQQNFYAVQFHPEKSGIAGEIILNNFINLS